MGKNGETAEKEGGFALDLSRGLVVVVIVYVY